MAFWLITFAIPEVRLAPATQPTFQDNRMEGILVKPLSNVSVYGSYSTNSGISSNTPVLWQSGKQYEFGIKAGFFDQNLTLAADHFQISEANVSTINPAHNTDATRNNRRACCKT